MMDECRRYTLAGYNTDRCATCGDGPFAHRLWFAWANRTPFSKRAAVNHTVPADWCEPQALIPIKDDRAERTADPADPGLEDVPALVTIQPLVPIEIRRNGVPITEPQQRQAAGIARAVAKLSGGADVRYGCGVLEGE